MFEWIKNKGGIKAPPSIYTEDELKKYISSDYKTIEKQTKELYDKLARLDRARTIFILGMLTTSIKGASDKYDLAKEDKLFFQFVWDWTMKTQKEAELAICAEVPDKNKLGYIG